MARIEIYSSNLCPYCRRVIRLLKGKGAPFEIIPITMVLFWKLPSRNFREMYRRSRRKTTMPQIFVNGEYYGDDGTLFADERNGRLDGIL